MNVCEAITTQNIDAVIPFLDAVASLAGRDNAPTALRATEVLDAVVETEPSALEGRVSELAEALDSVNDLRTLLDCLDRNSTVVRSRAIRAFGQLGDDGAVPKLRALTETASFLADTE